MKNKDLALILVVNFLWAANFLSAKIGMEIFTPLFFTALRFSIVIVVLLPFVSFPHGYWRKMLIIGVLMGVCHFSLMFWGLSLSPDISSVAIINQVFVPFSALLAMVFLKEKIGWRRWTAILMAFAGVMVIGFDPVIFANWLSPVLVIIASFMVSLNMVVVRTMPGVGALNLTFWTAAIGTLPLYVFSFLFEDGQGAALQTAGWEEWSAVAFSAIGATVVGHGLGNYLIKRYPVSTIAPYYLLVPIFAVALGMIFWGDVMTVELMVGGAMVMSGVTIITLRSAKKKPVKNISDG
ncbi:DMT family transporter [Sneathiella litorea]|uniref:EamA family transporter n=1 Tax=Sneathiella litorea TaxID=2606216 RepID=A0A6L8WB96_9PROT|nr:DMT family transporter [Sneathiella litorea]MZR32496.1 EamA family transporter [Sneathiella litorea]